ncbi:metalloprotease [Croceivirga thetidis]|uniref:metalloprotease n=1 Tax=Croceivirga thetidis TaxID=2721623 RepID=UPI001B2FE98C|nr:metalloprotease [Croceivirga thetidis]
MSCQKLFFFLIFTLCIHPASEILAQRHSNTISATLDGISHAIEINQEFVYFNNSGKPLKELYFNDWNHSYSSSTTALAKRFGEEFKKSLHLSKEKNRGFTYIKSITDSDNNGLNWDRKHAPDIIKIVLKEPLLPRESLKLFFSYDIQLPNSKFTTYGHGYLNGYYLNDWYLTPAVFDKEWKLYSNKDLNDLYTEASDTEIRLKYPKGLNVASNFKRTSSTDFSSGNFLMLTGTNRKSCRIILTPEKRFTTHKTETLTITTDLESDKYSEMSQILSIDRITRFLSENLGAFPHDNLLVSDLDYGRNPLYGLSLLPGFVRPYREQFQFELKFLKTALYNIVKESVYLDERKERWVLDGIKNYLMIKYVDEFYPNQKFTGKLSNVWLFRSYNLAKMDFNEQYFLLQMAAVRRNDHQSLLTPNDSLTRWNQKIANRYKAGLGLSFLGEYVGYDHIDKTIKDFYATHKTEPRLKATVFEEILNSNSEKDISWFFDEFLNQRKNIDFKIKKVVKTEDSLYVTIKNKTKSTVPISLFGLQNDSVITKYWLTDIDSTQRVVLPNNNETRLVLNYDKKIPETNQRNNWKSLTGSIFSNKKLQLRFFKDIENPYYNQLFYLPEFKFDVNNGITAGLTLNNRTFLNRNFSFSLKPQYSSKEQALVGSLGFTKRNFFTEGKLNSFNYSLSYSNFFFDTNSRFTTFTPSVSFNWRPTDFISNHRQFLFARLRNVFRNIDESVAETIDTDPDFTIFNVRYGDINNSILDFKSWVIDGQIAGNFSKLSVEWESRTLFNNNRQLNLRFYAGKFITNNTNSDFFSFALDRPTDYLFDLNYLNRSTNASGLSSQQFVLAEGGFKSIFDDRFGNDWIIAGNLSFNLWQWIEVYGDIGGIKDKGESARFVYDSGIRLNLVTDFFELYFPVYSNNGYEIAQPDYGERIRFVVTLSPRTLTGLFTRKWF